MSSVTISEEYISIKIKIKPLMITIYRGNKPLLQRLSNEVDYERSGVAGNLYNVEVENKDEKSIVLKCEGNHWSPSKAYARLKLSLNKRLLSVSWEAESEFDYISDTWVSACETQWYGQGQLIIQAFPLNSHIIEMRPFITGNIQPPLWFTKTGIAILIDNYQLFDTRFDRGITIRGLNTKSFSYKIFIENNLVEVRKRVLKKIGLPERIPDKRVLTKPIFTTWVQYKQEVDQEKVLNFVKEIKEHDFPCSVIQIDDRWEKKYGEYTFDNSKFPDPRMMVKTIHDAGFLATLWVHPFINRDSESYEHLKIRKLLVWDPEKDEPAEVKWWNGSAGLIDISNPEASQWLDSKLKYLKENYGFDGFKFDGGDAYFFPFTRRNDSIFRPIKIGRTYGNITPNQYTDEWLRFIFENHYNLAEARVGYLAQRFGIIAREGDKESSWGLDNGLYAAVTQALTLSITGYPYIMPDMIGGNQYKFKCDKELFIRWVEATALMPIVEYSITPWTYDDETVNIAKKYSLLHTYLGDYYISLAKRAKEEGDPIISPLVLKYPEDDKCALVNDEYLVGDLLIAPVLEKGCNERVVYIPEGKWIDFWSNREIKGPAEISSEAPLERLPLYFEAHDLELIAVVEKARKEVFDLGI
ncbi:MAG: glycoside hydrolase family 31 protein [Crenarchaeota archaeon]|nr:glycoside hydrolase family 31 protein [Thermoproteota archaeon]MDW8033640.1 glycoside hydrolase family 31 protein [Nitrososphaerota archaeon]